MLNSISSVLIQPFPDKEWKDCDSFVSSTCYSRSFAIATPVASTLYIDHKASSDPKKLAKFITDAVRHFIDGPVEKSGPDQDGD